MRNDVAQYTADLVGDNLQTIETDTAENQNMNIAMEQAFSNKNIAMKTDLNQRQINVLTRATVYAKRFKSKTMADVVKTYQHLLVSKGRQGRKELIQLTQSINSTMQPNTSVLEKLGFK